MVAAGVLVTLRSASSVADSTEPVSTSLAAADSSALAEKDIAALSPELRAQATDPKSRQGHRTLDGSLGGGQTLSRCKGLCCIFCLKILPSRIKRFKQHL
jgi:hypothetical protein